MDYDIYSSTKTTKLFEKFNTILYLCGLPNYWIVDVNLPVKFVKIFDYISTFLHSLTCVFTVLQIGAFITQNNLTQKQQADRLVCDLASPFTHFYCFIFLYYKKEVRDVLYHLTVLLKRYHNDLEVEKQMITKLKLYLLAYSASAIMTLTFYGVYGVTQAIQTGAPFVTIITAWPDVKDNSSFAETVRVIFYWFWWISFFRISGVYLLILSMLIGLSEQYKNLQNYFYSLNNIFCEDLSQTEKENKFEKAFVSGIDMHSDTLCIYFLDSTNIYSDEVDASASRRCVEQCKWICRIVFNAQMLLATSTIISLFPVMMNSKDDLGSALANVPTLMICLIATGYFMWNAGDISVEASRLPEAIYGSGWPDCQRRSSVRVRKLVVIAMTQAQQPVVLKALGFLELSYETYLAIIKTSYSVFSVFY